MELKKNPKADIRKNTAFYYAVGIAAIVLITYLGINHKTYDKVDFDISQLNIEGEDDEEVPMTEILQTPPPPPPPPAAPEVIEIVEDEEEIEETVIESTETDETVEIEEVEIEEEEEDVEVPFAIIENVPVFPGCERKTNNADRKKCMSEKISKFVRKKFDVDLASDLGLSGRQRILVAFKINKNGDVVGIRARAPHPALQREAERVIKMLPKMKPGRQRGKNVSVPYSLPIIFKVED